MKMKFIVNGIEKEIEILYGRSAVFTYDAIVGYADKDPAHTYYTVTYSVGKEHGSLTRGAQVLIDTGLVPVFNVANTSRA